MHPYAIISLFNAIAVVALGVFVFIKKPQGRIQRDWLLLSLAAGGWCLGTFFMNVADSPQKALFWNQVLNYFAIFIGPLFIKFGYSITRQSFKPASQFLLFFIAGLLLIAALAYPQAYLIEEVKGKYFHYIPRVGFIYHVYSGFFLGCVLYSLFFLYRQFKRSHKGATKNQLKYLFISMFIAFSGGASTLLICYGIEFPIGNYYFSLYAFVMSYAIVAHRLMDIEVIIKRTLVFAGIVASAVALISLPFVLVQTLIGRAMGIPNPFILMALGITTTVLIYRPVDRVLVNLTDKYLFQKRINYRVLLREATEYLAHVDSLKRQARTIVSFMLKKARIANAAVYAFISHDVAGLKLKASRPAIRDRNLNQINLTHPIITYFAMNRSPVEILSLREFLRNPEKSKMPKEQLSPDDIQKIIDLMDALNAEAAIPCFGGEVAAKLEGEKVHLKAILFLGHQKSDEPYSEEDLDVFFTLGQESSIAFENARLYDEAIERTKLLEETNRDLEDANEKLKVTQASLIVAEKNATMVGMAKAIAHEVNNPLSTVSGHATWIYRDELGKCKTILEKNSNNLPSEDANKLKKSYTAIDEYARKVKKSAGRIEIVVKTLTDILKDTKGEIGPLSLIVLCREAREATRFVTYDENLSGCQIKEDIVANLMIMGNLEQLLQVFVNLIKNAYEAMMGQNDRRIEIRGYPDKDDPKMAKIEFIDNGPGIPPEALPNIWKQGFSTKERKSDQIGAAGQGQGLYICKHMIESVHNGLISVESTPGQGTAFIIKLPLADMEG